MKKSFTLIELLVVISIMIIFIGIGLPQYNTYTEQTKLKNEAKKLVDVLELAKKKSMSADLVGTCADFTGYRVTTSANAYLLLFGCSSIYTSVQNYNLSTNITITATGIGDFNFPTLMKNLKFGVAPNINSVQLKNSAINKCVNISISDIGIVELDETLMPC